MERGKRKKIDAMDSVGGAMREPYSSGGWLNFGESCPCQARPTVTPPLAELRRNLSQTLSACQRWGLWSVDCGSPSLPPHVNLPRLFALS
jgi:hypothetical protein